MTKVLRSDVLREARSWIGTPFKHQARVKGVGVDCVGLAIGVSRALGLVHPGFDVHGYSAIPDGTSFMQSIALNMTWIPTDQAQPGDAVVVAFSKDPQHIGILGDYRGGRLSIIHAAGSIGRVVETRLLFSPVMKLVGMYKLPGID